MLHYSGERPEWDAYLQAVYRTRDIHYPFDVSRLTWLYWSAPLNVPVKIKCGNYNVVEAFGDGMLPVLSHPEVGFFVAHRAADPVAMQGGEQWIEVMRSDKPDSEGVGSKVIWYHGVTGSGIWLHLGRTLDLRCIWTQDHKETYWHDVRGAAGLFNQSVKSYRKKDGTSFHFYLSVQSGCEIHAPMLDLLVSTGYPADEDELAAWGVAHGYDTMMRLGAISMFRLKVPESHAVVEVADFRAPRLLLPDENVPGPCGLPSTLRLGLNAEQKCPCRGRHGKRKLWALNCGLAHPLAWELANMTDAESRATTDMHDQDVFAKPQLYRPPKTHRERTTGSVDCDLWRFMWQPSDAYASLNLAFAPNDNKVDVVQWKGRRTAFAK
eukprot:CAMPEP_0119327922 /NCGR_PEP_ID=MMETSP1333-20130426/71988_1 /TAXON_ID=418940 /ORGANISM="Scyphosphaera apsteinii, Strain RCC1455" /LENGTH=379 /DNA_ID=CAMNT_0007336645 /DNA_START=400 /DNA_END=1536 /DNA_ORIENTATION=-